MAPSRQWDKRVMCNHSEIRRAGHAGLAVSQTTGSWGAALRTGGESFTTGPGDQAVWTAESLAHTCVLSQGRRAQLRGRGRTMSGQAGTVPPSRQEKEAPRDTDVYCTPGQPGAELPPLTLGPVRSPTPQHRGADLPRVQGQRAMVPDQPPRTSLHSASVGRGGARGCKESSPAQQPPH